MTEIFYFIPEVILAAVLFAGVVSEISYRGERKRLVPYFSLFGAVSALFWALGLYQYDPARIFGQKLLVDGPAVFFKIFFILLGILSILILREGKELSVRKQTEYMGFTLSAVLFFCIATSATHLLVLFLALLKK